MNFASKSHSIWIFSINILNAFQTEKYTVQSIKRISRFFKTKTAMHNKARQLELVCLVSQAEQSHAASSRALHVHVIIHVTDYDTTSTISTQSHRLSKKGFAPMLRSLQTVKRAPPLENKVTAEGSIVMALINKTDTWNLLF